MPYVVPTVEEFQARFPEIEVGSDQLELLQFLLEERATRQVDETWLEDDYQEGILLLTAHMFTTNRAVSGASAGGETVSSESIGPISVSYGAGGSASLSAAKLGTTVYGEEFRALRAQNVPAVMTVI